MEDELPTAGGRINALLDTAKPDALFLKPGDGLDEVLERSTQAVQPPDNEGIAGADEVQGIIESWPVGFGAAGSISKDALTAGFLKSILLES